MTSGTWWPMPAALGNTSTAGNGPWPEGLAASPAYSMPAWFRLNVFNWVNVASPSRWFAPVWMNVRQGRCQLRPAGARRITRGMGQADLSASGSTRVGAAVLVIVLHVLAVSALIRAFAPDLGSRVAQEVLAAFSVSPPPSPTPPPPPPPSSPQPHAAPERQAAAAGTKARSVTAPVPRVAVATTTAPVSASTGSADSSGEGRAGAGSGAGGAGNGTGGGGGATAALKIAGDINSARDYPRETRDLRIGDYVIVALSVTPEGRVSACRVVRASRDAAADATTCRLAQSRFRFRPATDASGRAVASTFGWKQRWFYPDGKN